ncbi:hypothetical protein AB1Y20_021122 [Prymnesium parvum]|uniref:V-type proton ATPase subunit n=1 Tax=Prymnesium parvum TaxID=97485 RepID=A0AB34JHF7_PRYPA
MSTAIITGTLVYGALGVVAQVCSRFSKAAMSDKGLTTLLIWLTVACCWLMWVITYMMQLNPLIQPIVAAEE